MRVEGGCHECVHWECSSRRVLPEILSVEPSIDLLRIVEILWLALVLWLPLSAGCCPCEAGCELPEYRLEWLPQLLLFAA